MSESKYPDDKKDLSEIIQLAEKQNTKATSKFIDLAKIILLSFGIAFFAMCFVEAGNHLSELSADQKKVVNEWKIQNFLTSTCKAKTVCPHFAEVRLSCAEAGSIQKCIEIRMKGEDYSLCTDDGNISGIDDKLMPSFSQCTGNKMLSFANQK